MNIKEVFIGDKLNNDISSIKEGSEVMVKNLMKSSRSNDLITKKYTGIVINKKANGLDSYLTIRIQLGREYVYKRFKTNSPRFVSVDILKKPNKKHKKR